MKITELRVGNYVNVPKFNDGYPFYTIRHFMVGEVFFMQKLIEGCLVDEIEPIPITDEWITKLGLKEDGVFPDIEYYSIYRLNSDDKLWGLYFEGEYTATDIKYVHELQNLYYALVGTELTIY